MILQLRQIASYAKTTQLYTITYKLIHVKSYIENVSKTLEEKFKDYLVQPKIEKEMWESIRNYVVQLNLHPSIVDSVLLTVLKEKGLIDVGISYYQFLVKNKYDLSVLIQTKLLQLYENKRTIEERDKKCILNVYEHFMNEYEILETEMSNALVKNLCIIGEWRKAIEVIKKFEKHDQTFLRSSYDELISALYNCGKPDKAYKYLLISFEKGKGPLECAYTAYLKYHLKDKHTVNEKIDKLFSMWKKYGINPSEQTIQEYIAVCNDLGWSATQTTLEGLKCTVCKQELSQNLSDNDYERLYRATRQKLIFDHVHYISNPKEVNNFINFIEKRKPYDIVIDGLNLIYSYNGYETLQRSLRQHKSKGRKVLFIGRRHVKNMIKKMELQEFADYFYVDNLSKDDPFILCAAFASGKSAKVISKDLMRQHKFVINDIELNTLFKRWQISQQYILQENVKNMKKLTKETPIDGIAEKVLNCWHIPYVHSSVAPRKRHTCIDNWACFNMCP